MEHNPSSEQYRKLEELYADMSDARLHEMADGAADLTEIAQHVLRAEISKRGLDKQARAIASDEASSNPGDVVSIWKLNNAAKAQSVVDALNNAGIAACVVPEKLELADGGSEEQHDVRVVRTDTGRALEIIRASFPDEDTPEEEVDTRMEVCPNCQSADIVLESVDAAPGEGSSQVYNWSCGGCGHQWKDEGQEQLA
jgi:hypothetical protein